MKVVHVITGVNVGGAETMLARLLASGHRAPDIDAEVISLTPPGAAGARIAAMGIPVHSLGMVEGRPSLAAATKLVALMRAIRPDLIIGWMHHGQIAASFAAFLCPGDPTVIWNVRHSLGGYRQEKPLSRAVLRLGAWLSKAPAMIVYNSRTAAHQYRAFGYRPRNEEVIPNGFELRAATARWEARERVRSLFGVDAGALLIGMIARSHPMKDVPTLVRAFARVLAARPDCRLLVVGEGMDRPSGAVQEALRQLPDGSYVLSGHRGDVAEWLSGLDVLALPSAWGEGFPNILGEALACGVPCVATDVGDAAWVVGEAGRIVRPGDPAALADALLDLAALGPDGREQLGALGRARVENCFALETIAARYHELFRRHARVPEARRPRLSEAGAR